MRKQNNDRSHIKAREQSDRSPDKFLSDLSQLYANYGQGEIPQHILDLAQQIEAKMIAKTDGTTPPASDQETMRDPAKKKRRKKTSE